MTRALLLILLALAGGPAAASAATAALDVDRTCLPGDELSTCTTTHALTVVAAPGETNALTVTRTPDTIVIADAQAPLTAGPGCVQSAAGQVTCPLALPPEPGRVVIGRVRADAGDGADRLTLVAGPGPAFDADLVGGAGDDAIAVAGAGDAPGSTVHLAGGDGADTLTGGPRAEELDGGPGDDVLRGGDGDDRLSGEAGDDTVDGGPGRDEGVYEEHTEPVVVDLADPGPDGAAGERDRLTSVEDLTGFHPRDVLRGDAGPNHIIGRGRADGRGGDDLIETDGAVRCGTGRADVVVAGDTKAPRRLAADCERARLGDLDVEVRPARTTRTTTTLRVHGPGDDLVARARLSLTRSWRGGRTVRVSAGMSRLVTLPGRGRRVYDVTTMGSIRGVVVRGRR